MDKSLLGSTHTVPYAVTQPNRIPKQRYYDPEFYELECKHLWPRVWQMACRLEEIPNPGDYVVYDILDQSIIVTRVNATTIKAYHNVCRHRGVQLCKDRGRASSFICPFHGWAWNLEGENTFVFSPELFDDASVDKNLLKLREVRLETWGGCAFINLDDKAPPLRPSLEPFATLHDAWHVETLRTEWWLSARLPCNWKLAMEAFQEGYHVMKTHPQLVAPGITSREARYAPTGKGFPGAKYWTASTNPPTAVDPETFVEMNIAGMKLINTGMAGLTHEKDVRIAETLRGLDLPTDLAQAGIAWHHKLNDAVVEWNKKAGMDVADLNDIMDRQVMDTVNFCFPHFFLLPSLSSASSYRIRPLGPEECLFEIWSLTRYPEGEQPPPIKTPTPMAADDPRWPPIPKQDFSNLPIQQKGLHSLGIDDEILSKDVEGIISNNHRLIDGYLAGLAYDKLLPAVQKVSGPIDAPIADLGF